jgi:hypothetical protein
MPKYHPQDPVLEQSRPKLFSSVRERYTLIHSIMYVHMHKCACVHARTHARVHIHRKSRVQNRAKFSNHFHVTLNIHNGQKKFFSILCPVDLHQLCIFVTKTLCMKNVGHKICQAMPMQVHIFFGI